MIELTDEMRRKIQLVQLDMLIELNRVCRLHGIKYSLAGGTLLGAVRHKGFIPWDFDIDVVMNRDNYNKFREIFDKTTDSKKYYFQDMDNTPGYYLGYARIRRKGTVYRKVGNDRLPFGQEIFIEIFPLDNVPNGTICRSFHSIHCYCLRKLLWKSKYYSWIPLELLKKHYRRFAVKYNNRCTYRSRPITMPIESNWKSDEDPYQNFENMVELEFEGHKFLAVKKWEYYLIQKYGEYMTPPPEKKRGIEYQVAELKLPEDSDNA